MKQCTYSSPAAIVLKVVTEIALDFLIDRSRLTPMHDKKFTTEMSEVWKVYKMFLTNKADLVGSESIPVPFQHSYCISRSQIRYPMCPI